MIKDYINNIISNIEDGHINNAIAKLMNMRDENSKKINCNNCRIFCEKYKCVAKIIPNEIDLSSFSCNMYQSWEDYEKWLEDY